MKLTATQREFCVSALNRRLQAIEIDINESDGGEDPFSLSEKKIEVQYPKDFINLVNNLTEISGFKIPVFHYVYTDWNLLVEKKNPGTIDMFFFFYNNIFYSISCRNVIKDCERFVKECEEICVMY